MNNRSSNRRLYLVLFALLGALGLHSDHAHADFSIVSRYSQMTIDTTNLGGAMQSASTTSTEAPFEVLLFDTATHIEPGGNINGGIWNSLQVSQVGPSLIRSNMHTEAITQQLAGDGIGVLDMTNKFEVEFQVTEPTNVELRGTYFGTSDSLFADDFIRVQFQFHNGVTFITMFLTTDADQLSAPFEVELQPGTLYRLAVDSEAHAMGAETSVSGAEICLRAPAFAGDVNLDGAVNLLDVGPFIDAIALGDYQAEADTNCDGSVDLLDVSSFIEILSSL